MYPSQVEIDDATIGRLTQTFKTAYSDIVGEIETATDWGVQNRKQILAQIDAILEELGQDVQKFTEQEITKAYETGAGEAVDQLNNIGADVSVATGFNRVHQQAIAALVDETAKAFGESMTGVLRSAEAILGRATREAITQKIATGIIGGAALKQVKNAIKGTIREQGLDALIDKGGHTWTLDRYAEMLFRTKVVEARNRGLINRMVENNYDLVQVSAHVGSCDQCAPWQGQILSATGKTPGYQTIMDAEVGGLFHPNCRHAINTLIPSLAKQTTAYNPDLKTTGKPGESLLPGYEKIVSRSLIPDATAYKPTFDKKLQKIADEVGWKWKDGPVKKAPRTAEKILYDYNGNIYAMKDVNRSVFFISDPTDKKEFNKLIASVEKQFGTIAKEDIKIGLNVTDSYASNKLSVMTPYGAKAEIQITTPEMWKAKIDLGGDSMYGEWRDPNTAPERKKELFNKMESLYSKANDLTIKRLAGL